MASEGLPSKVAESESIKVPWMIIDREVFFLFPVPVHQHSTLFKFLAQYIQRKFTTVIVDVNFMNSPDRVYNREMRVTFILLENWDMGSTSMPSDWTEYVDSIINEGVQEALNEGLLPPRESWLVFDPNKFESDLQLAVVSDNLPSDVAKQSDNFVGLPIVREVSFGITIPAGQQKAVTRCVVKYIKEKKHHILVSAKFKSAGPSMIPQNQMTVRILLLRDGTPPAPVPSEFWESFDSIIDEAPEKAVKGGLLPEDETWIISGPGTWRASLPQDDQAQDPQAPVASDSLTREGVGHANLPRKFPIRFTDREVSFWIAIPPFQQSGLVEFVVKHIQEQYGPLISVSAEFMYPNGLLIPQNQMIVRILMLWGWIPPSPLPLDRTKYVDSIIDEALRAALGLLPKGEIWTISAPDNWRVISPLPPMASEVSDPSIMQSSLPIILEVDFSDAVPEYLQPNFTKFMVDYIKLRLGLFTNVTVAFIYPSFVANKMTVKIQVLKDGKLPSPLPLWPGVVAVLEEAVSEALKYGLLPKGETWKIKYSKSTFFS